MRGIWLCAGAGCVVDLRADVIKRAVFDLQCDQSRIEVKEIGTYVYGVRGCGKRASYVFKDAQVLRDSEVMQDGK